MSDRSYKLRQVKTRPAKHPELQSSSEGSKAASKSRSRLKRKHEEIPSMQPQCQVLHYQMPSCQEFTTEEQTIQQDTSAEHNLLEITDEKQEETVPLLLNDPAQDYLMLEDAQLKTSTGHTVNSVNIPKPNVISKHNERPKINQTVNTAILQAKLNADSNTKLDNHVPMYKLGLTIPIPNSNLESGNNTRAPISIINLKLVSRSKIAKPIPKSNSNHDSNTEIGDPLSQTNLIPESRSKIANPTPINNSSLDSRNRRKASTRKNNSLVGSSRKIGNTILQTNSNVDSASKIWNPIPETNSNLHSTSEIGNPIPETNSNLHSTSEIGNPIPETNSNLHSTSEIGNLILETNSNLHSTSEIENPIPETNSSIVSDTSKPNTLNQNDDNCDISTSGFFVQCQECKEFFTDMSCVKSHKCPASSVPLFALPASSLPKDEYGNIQASECPLCKALYISDDTLQNHVLSDHPEVANQCQSQKMVPESIHFPQDSSVVPPNFDAQKIVPESNYFYQQSPNSGAQEIMVESNHFSQLTSYGAEEMVPESIHFPQESSVMSPNLPNYGAKEIVLESNNFSQQSPNSGAQEIVPEANVVLPVNIHPTVNKPAPQMSAINQFSSRHQCHNTPTSTTREMGANCIVQNEPGVISPQNMSASGQPLTASHTEEIVPESNLVTETISTPLEPDMKVEITESYLISESTDKIVPQRTSQRNFEPQKSKRQLCKIVKIGPTIPKPREKKAESAGLKWFVVVDCDTESSAHQEFYKHFCKFHLKLEDSQTTSTAITIPHLIQSVTPAANNLGLYQCKHCDMAYENTGEYEMHVYTAHNVSEGMVECKICQFRKPFQWERFMNHLWKHKDHFIHFVNPEEPWRCLKCEILSDKCVTLVNTDVHFGFKKLTITRKRGKLPNCVYFEYSVDHQYPHVRSLYSCVCFETFESQADLNQHLESHVDCVFRKCSACAMSCDSMNHYYQHIEKMHAGKVLLDVDFRKRDLSFKHETTFCRVCCAKCINNCSLQLHQQQMHQSQIETKVIATPRNSKKIFCTICDVGFFDPKLFYAHSVPYSPLLPNSQKDSPYSPLLPNLQRDCPKCVVCFNSDEEFKAHLDETHDGIDSYWCRICNIPQHSPENLDSHVVNDHNISMFYCVLCKTNFLSKKLAFVHLKTCYSEDETDLICPNCGFICDDFDFFINHVRVEFECLPQHQCKFCLNYFNGKLNLACHLLDTKCVHCGLHFCNAEILLEHAAKVHAK